MNKHHVKYALYVIITIAIGLASRRLPWVPLFIGDALYAVMMYFIVRFFLIEKNEEEAAAYALLITYIIEFSQLYRADWLDALRQTLPGRLVLGQGFLLSDLVAYTAGIAVVLVIHKLERKLQRMLERGYE